jgi:phospholipid/cholesterol/gamma-HCH transport system permease protein
MFGVFFQILSLVRAVARESVRFPWRGREILSLIDSLGVQSLPIIVIATAAAGLVTTNEIAWHMNSALQTVSMIPGFTGQFIFRELGVVIPAFLMISKVGASLTAEIGSMKITEQLDALKMLKIDPVAYLVFPRWIACTVSLICLTLVSLAVTLLCAMLAAMARYHFNFMEYSNALLQFVRTSDVICAIVKSAVFGAVIPLISCAYGFRCQGGSQGVGEATTQSVVTSTLVVIVLDFLLTTLFVF